MFQLIPLLGARSTSTASQSLLQLDGGIKILVDLGWDEDFDAKKLEGIAMCVRLPNVAVVSASQNSSDLEYRHVNTLSFILLTHATSKHLAAFAHCCKHIPTFSQIPVYATSPVISLGRTLLEDIYSSTPLASTTVPEDAIDLPADDAQILLQPPTAEEIAAYFALVHPLKYSQPHQPLPSPFSAPLNDLTITAYNAGHSLGGTIWHIQHGMESIVYAVDWSQLRENVFSGAAWLRGSGGTEVIEQLRKPTALVCSSRGGQRTALAGGRVKRDKLLIEMIRSCVEKGGTVLIPTDTSARALELAYVLEHAWRTESSGTGNFSKLKSTKLYLASRSARDTMRYASSMLEWMDDTVVREFESEAADVGQQQHRRGNSKQANVQRSAQKPGKRSQGPFDFQFLKMLQSQKSVEWALSKEGPRVFLATDSTLTWGFSADVLERIAGSPDNLVILTEIASKGPQKDGDVISPSATLWKWFADGKASMTEVVAADGSTLEFVNAGGKRIESRMAEKLPLVGMQLNAYDQFLANQRQAQNLSQIEGRTTFEAVNEAVDDGSSSSSSDDESDPERQGKALNSTFKAAKFNKSKIEPSKEALGVNALLRCQGVYDYDVRDKRGRDLVFPFLHKRRRADEFGEVIKPEDYLRAEERDDVGGQGVEEDGKSGKKEGLGQKRLWQEALLQNDPALHRSSTANGMQQQKSRPATKSRKDTLKSVDIGEADDSTAESDIEDLDEAALKPSKIIFKPRSFEAHLNIAHVDFMGIHDQRSLTMLIPIIQPKKLILVGGNPSETEALATECGQKLNDGSSDKSSIFSPRVGELVDASVDTNAWTIKLSESLAKQLHWQHVKGLGVVTLAGQLAATLLDSVEKADIVPRKKPKLEDEDRRPIQSVPPFSAKEVTEALPTLGTLPSTSVAAARSMAQTLHVGDLRLADLRKLLQSTGHTADFRGEGTLLVDGFVAVRKSSRGTIEVESCGPSLTEPRSKVYQGSFQAVKRKIYDGLAVIAGG